MGGGERKEGRREKGSPEEEKVEKRKRGEGVREVQGEGWRKGGNEEEG